MKLLGWVQRKLRREAARGDPHSDVVGGNYPCSRLSPQPSLEDLQPHHQHHPRPPSPLHHLFCEDGCREATEPDEPQTAPREDLLFQGLLAIGTLGLGPTLEDLPPPQLLRLFNSIVAEKEKPEATENCVKAPDPEPVKALTPGTGDKNDQRSSARASSAGLCRGELFSKSQTAEESSGSGGGGGEKGERVVAAMMRKMLKRRGSKTGAAACGGDVEAPPAGGLPRDASAEETKFYKILKMFHKKVHPEGSIAQKKDAYTKSPGCNTHAGAAAGVGSAGGTAIAFSTRAPKKDDTPCCFRSRSHSPVLPGLSSLCGGSSNGSNREKWIKTDMDYVVLEL